MYLLDTNICIYVLKNHPDSLRHKFNATQGLSISSIVYAELCFGIENSDLLIAAHARSLNVILVTNNVREFNRVPDLLIENWVSD